MTSLAMNLLERDLVPDFLIRRRIRSLLAARLREEDQRDPERQQQRLSDFLRQLAASPVAIETAAANEQHYEVPTEFYQRVLGKHLKYSSGLFPHPNAAPAENLAAAEARMLALTCQRARLDNGQRILELGCGWGSLSLWMAANYPGSKITAVSNSRTQKLHIDEQARARNLRNLEVVTCDVNHLAFAQGTLLPERFRSGAFIGEHGSWNRIPLSGYKVVFVPFVGGKSSGKPVDVLTGFLNGLSEAQGRPAGLAFDRAGALLVADDVGNAVWRVGPAASKPAP